MSFLTSADLLFETWDRYNEKALEALPDGTLLLLDEAYIEFAPHGTALQIDPDDPRVIRLRTFSKAFGMAGARVGYGIGAPELIKSFDKVRNHFGMSRISQVGALAAFEDEVRLAEVITFVADARDLIGTIARANGLTPLPSATNFVTLDCGQDGAFAKAAPCFRGLIRACLSECRLWGLGIAQD